MSLLLKSRDIFCVCGYEILENGKLGSIPTT